ncbi:zf-CCHC domain-containing protein/RVP_2 domain-containing protein [Cephalotus follicularis]|uniref:Zf-CCHC domain-containing protein/RVP_2 domain-containing protein n=1 Tax=Cephalotus follicularis TaxID=3775 RepID=A0A1Q3CD02_CEPFO|nr:zf-CCHC domain-containing protein/RVP_2 domain-containing protein [Cephalotus follicularis]
MELRTYVEVAQKARLLETISSEDRAEKARARESKQSPTQSRPTSSKWQDGGSPTKSSKNKSQQTASQGTPSQGSNARSGGCFYCGRTGHQQKDYWKFNGWCLRCRAPGHSVKDCPKSSATAPTGPGSSSGAAAGPSQRRDTRKGIAKGRIFVLAQTEVPESTSVVGGTLYIYGYSARVLMDSGASHSFISAHFASCLDVTPDCMSFILDVSTPTGTSMYTDSVYRSCEMYMGGIPLYANLIVLPIRDFDVILGMDWLSAYLSRMDCYHKTGFLSARWNDFSVQGRQRVLDTNHIIYSCFEIPGEGMRGIFGLCYLSKEGERLELGGNSSCVRISECVP